jgi:hypothetical protein
VVVVDLAEEEFQAWDMMQGHGCPEYVDPYPRPLPIDRRSDSSLSVSLIRSLRCFVRKEIFWTR